MRRFRFRLEAALRLRRLAEEKAQAQLAEALHAAQQADARLTELVAARAAFQARRAALHVRELDFEKLMAADLLDRDMAERIESQRGVVREARALVDERVQELNARHADREVLERLRERRIEEHRAAELAAEQAAMDEAAVLRWQRS